MADRIYVIGHVNPDTNNMAAAVGYAGLLRERDGPDTGASLAERAAQLSDLPYPLQPDGTAKK